MRAVFAEDQCHILVDFSRRFRDQEYCVVGAKGAGAPGVVLRLTDLVLVAELGHRPALQPFEHDHGFRLRVPIASLHGCLLSKQPQHTQLGRLLH